jgi:cytochrome P450
MIDLNSVKQLEEEEAARRADDAEKERKTVEKRRPEHLAWLKDAGFSRAMREVDDAITYAVKDARKSVDVEVGDDSDGEFLSRLVVTEAESHGYEAFSERKFIPAEGDYVYGSCWVYTVTIAWK